MHEKFFYSNGLPLVLRTESSRLVSIIENSVYIRHLLPDFNDSFNSEVQKGVYSIEIAEWENKGTYEALPGVIKVNVVKEL